MENLPCSISSFAGFPSLMEACVVNKSNSRVSIKALSHGAGLSPQTEDVSAGNDTIGNGAGLSLDNEGLSATELQRKGTSDSSKIVQPEKSPPSISEKPVSYSNVLQNVLFSQNASGPP